MPDCKKCGQNREKARMLQPISVFCETCTEPLVGQTGRSYPVHLGYTPVPRYQVVLWESDGYELTQNAN